MNDIRDRYLLYTAAAVMGEYSLIFSISNRKNHATGLSGKHTDLKRANGGGEEVVVLEADHVLVLGVSRRNVLDVVEQGDH